MSSEDFIYVFIHSFVSVLVPIHLKKKEKKCVNILQNTLELHGCAKIITIYFWGNTAESQNCCGIVQKRTKLISRDISPKNENSAIIYSPCYKPVSFCSTEERNTK